MKTYEITLKAIYLQTYTVEAESKDEAMENLGDHHTEEHVSSDVVEIKTKGAVK